MAGAVPDESPPAGAASACATAWEMALSRAAEALSRWQCRAQWSAPWAAGVVSDASPPAPRPCGSTSHSPVCSNWSIPHWERWVLLIHSFANLSFLLGLSSDPPSTAAAAFPRTNHHPAHTK